MQDREKTKLAVNC